MERNFEYEVAISLLHQDESEASQIISALVNIPTFLYSRKQEELVGNDVVLKFKDVFGKRSRIVVILYREDWGDTGFTFVEREAIRDRIFRDKTEDFIILVNMTGKEKLPDWISDRTIYYDYKEFKLNGLIGLIKHKIRALGGLKRPETIKEIADRKAAEYEFRSKRFNFINSPEGVQKADIEFQTLCNLIREHAKTASNPYIQLELESDGNNTLLVKHNSLTLNINWCSTVSNTLESHERPAHLDVAIMKRDFNRDRYDTNPYFLDYKQIYRFNMFFPDFIGWNKDNSKEYIPTNNLADNIIKKVLDYL